MDWDDLKHVAALAETGSVRRAGARLGLHGATVARHVERLETRLGVRLFARTRRGMEVTEAGLRLVATYREMAGSLDALEHELQAAGPALAGPATLHVTEALATGWLIPRLREFTIRYPEIQLQVHSVSGLPLLAPGAAEAVLLLTREPPGHLVGRRLGAMAICGYRAESAASHAEVAQLLDSAGLLGPLLPEFARAWRDSGRGPASDSSIHCPALPAQLEASQAGLGIAVLPCALGDAMPGLTRADPALPLEAGDVWLLSHPDSRGIARLLALLGYVQEIWTADRTRLEGLGGAVSVPTNG